MFKRMDDIVPLAAAMAAAAAGILLLPFIF
jgi:hypothetical protein